MCKYLIEFDQLLTNSETGAMLWKARGFSTLVFDRHGISKLKPMDNDACIDHLQETGWMLNHDKEIYNHGRTDGTNYIALNHAQAREAGYEDGYNDGLKALQRTELYTNGMNDAWAAALQVVLPDRLGGKYTSDELRKIFGVEFDYQCLQKYTPQEVIRKLSDYDEQKKKSDQEIRVGDEVSFHYDDRPDTVMVVTDIYDQAGDLHICGMDARGMQYAGKLAKCWEKTGRHFDQVSQLLEAMKANNG